jgi:hypothetical protein
VEIEATVDTQLCEWLYLQLQDLMVGTSALRLVPFQQAQVAAGSAVAFTVRFRQALTLSWNRFTVVLQAAKEKR